MNKICGFTLLILILLLGGNMQAATKYQQASNPLKVLIGEDGKSVFSENAGVDGLETVLAAVLGQLIYSSRSAELHPGLLKKFYWDYDNQWYVLELKENLKFHNGRTATADDLEFSFVRGFLSKNGSWFKSFFSNIEGINDIEGKAEFKPGMISGIQKLNKTSIRIKLSAPNPAFLQSLARSYFSLVAREALHEDYITWKSFPVGAGPYKVTSLENEGALLKLKKVNEAQPGPNEIWISSSRRNFAPDISFLRSNSDRKLQQEISDIPTSSTGIFFNFDNPLGKDKNFREAVSLAINRTKLVGNVKSYFPNDQLLTSQFWGRIEKKDSFDPKKATDIVRNLKAKLSKSSVTVPVFRSEFGNRELGAYIAELKKQLKAVGINAIFKKTNKKFFDDSDRGYPMKVLSLGADVSDPTVMFGLFRKGSPLKPHYPENDSHYENLFQQVSKESALDKKAEAVKQISQYFVDQNYAVPLFESHSWIMAKRERIKDIGTQDGGLCIYLDRIVMNQ